MKRISLLLAAFLSVCICFGQNGHSERTFKRLENKLYIVENGIKYKVDETRVIAKLKPQRELPRTLCEKSQNLGFDILEIPVPDGMRVEDYVSIIERTDDFEYVDYNTYGNGIWIRFMLTMHGTLQKEVLPLRLQSWIRELTPVTMISTMALTIIPILTY